MARNTMLLQAVPLTNEDFKAKAAEAILPGHLLDFTGTNTGEVEKHGTAAVNALPMFALPREEAGEGIVTLVAYGDGEFVKVGYFHTGEKIQARIASGQDLDEGDFLESAGDGTLRVLAASAATAETARSSIVAVSVASSGGAAGAEQFHSVRIM